MSTSRRSFLHALSAGAAAAAFPASIVKALQIPAGQPTGTIRDVGHIVILMQENRSFDHYFGSLRGVRGFGDPRAVRLADGSPNGSPVWRQADLDRYVLPFHPGEPDLGLRFLEDLPHDWNTSHLAWRDGHYDRWIAHKGPTTMAHLVRSDMPFHYALADAFTICDAYHCSLLGPTDPNRYHMFTGWVGNDGRGGGPVVGNEEAGYAWSTFPERLERAGISWKVYQDLGHGLSEHTHWGDGKDAYTGTYGDNSLLFFHQYQRAQPHEALYQRARTGTRTAHSGTLFDVFRRDLRAGRLPQVSWIVAPEAYCEHPNWPVNYGAWYIAQVLDALTANPEVWSRTALFITYDENDGFFDHAVPPTPPLSPTHGHSDVDASLEIYAGDGNYLPGPYGLGVRVPMLVVSPWSKGGWVNSQLFDHTSLIRFIEQRFASDHPDLIESNITPWRRAVCGDLTSAFDFHIANHSTVALPSTIAYEPPGRKRHPDYKPLLPETPVMPTQEPGIRPARPLPYELHADAAVDGRALQLNLRNTGAHAAVLQIRFSDGVTLPRSCTVSPGRQHRVDWTTEDDRYSVCVYGPNGFYRGYQGSFQPAAPVPQCELSYGRERTTVVLAIRTRVPLELRNGYGGPNEPRELLPGDRQQLAFDLAATHGWYDLTVTGPDFCWQFAGHLETGEPSVSDPAMGTVLG